MLLTSLLAVAVVAVAGAQPEPAPQAPKRPMRQMREEMREQLNLNDQQQEQMQKLRSQFEKNQEQLASKVRLSRIDLRDLVRAEKPDRAAIEKTIKGISELQLQQKMNLVDHLFAVQQILTPEQQKIWKKHLAGMAMEFREGRRGGMPGMRGPGMGGPGMPQMRNEE